MRHLRGVSQKVWTMIEPAPRWVRRRVQSFGYAMAGLRYVVTTQPHARFHLVAAIVAASLAVLLHLSNEDWRWIIVSVLFVWVSEAFNTAIENVCDVVSPGHHASVKAAKDIAAGAVLIAAVGAAIIGAMTFFKYV
jgi:diacylglycerol kinase (ATP)